MSVYNPSISVQSSSAVDISATGLTYEELLNALSQYNFLIDNIFMQCLSFNQVMQVLYWETYDANGIKRFSVTPPTPDPYQKQPTILLDIKPEHVLLNGRSQLSFDLLSLETVRLMVFARKNYLSDYLKIRNRELVYKPKCFCPGKEKYAFNLVIKNNTTSTISLGLLNIGNPLGFFNSRTQYSWDITGQTFTTGDQISIQVKLSGASAFTTYTTTLLDENIQGVVAALNSLNVGTFYYSGNVIYTRNDIYVYGDLGVGAAVSAGIDWVSRSSAADNAWNDITFGGGLFVAVASNGGTNQVMTSPDGVNWTLRTNPNSSWIAVTFGGGMFVATSGPAATSIMSSPDGINWTARVAPNAFNWAGLTYGAGLFVAVGQGSANDGIMTSPDGITWTTRVSPADNDWQSVVYANGLFVAVAETGVGNRVMTSPDGITWTLRSSAADNQWVDVTYGNGLFVAVGLSGGANCVMTSPDGINWTLRTAVGLLWTGVTYGNGLFVAVAVTGVGNRVMTSPDGINWTLRNSASDNNWSSVEYSNNIFVSVAFSGVGNRVMTSGTKL